MSAVAPLSIQPKPREPLAQVELLVLFHPVMQSGGAGRVTEVPRNCSQQWVTVDVFGKIGRGEISGKPVVEDMDLEIAGEDANALLEPLADEISYYVAGEQ